MREKIRMVRSPLGEGDKGEDKVGMESIGGLGDGDEGEDKEIRNDFTDHVEELNMMLSCRKHDGLFRFLDDVFQ